MAQNKRLTSKKTFLAIILAHEDSSPWVALVGISLYQAVYDVGW